MDVKFPVGYPKVEMEILSARLNPHKPVVMRHLFQVDRSVVGDDFIESGPSVRQLALGSNLKRTAIFIP
jgi:hypothetical protein